MKAGSTYGGSTGAAKNGNKVSVPAGNYNSRADKVQLELTALQLKKAVFTPRNR